MCRFFPKYQGKQGRARSHADYGELCNVRKFALRCGLRCEMTEGFQQPCTHCAARQSIALLVYLQVAAYCNRARGLH